MMKAAQIAREGGSYFGICYGFQWATVEFARHVADLTDADSTECDPDTPTKLIYKLRDLLGVDELGGTMRLGAYACELTPGSLVQRLYSASLIHERHRHRYEFNCLYERTLVERGLRISGRSPDGQFVGSPSCRDIPTSPCSSIRSSSQSRCVRTRCSPASSRPLTATRPRTACRAPRSRWLNRKGLPACAPVPPDLPAHPPQI